MSDTVVASANRPKILVVDDLYANRVAMRHVVVGLDVEVLEAASGNEALSICVAHEIALILLDVQMPGMDGVEVAALLQGEEATRDTAVIFVTAGSTDDMDRLKGYDVGAVDYITKPLNARLLSAKMANFVALYENRRALRKALIDLDATNEKLRAEIDERKRAEARARELATHDALTGLPNRLLFLDRLATVERRAERHRSTFALGYMDLDGFKPINDVYGHRAGDMVLGEIAQRLSTLTRESDTVARFGGDEFALIFEDITDPAACHRRCQALRKKLSQPIEVAVDDRMRSVAVGVSIGIALYPLHGDNSDRLMHNADRALYAVKNRGKANVRIFDPAEDEWPDESETADGRDSERLKTG